MRGLAGTEQRAILGFSRRLLARLHPTGFSMNKLRSVFRELAMAAHRDTGEYKVPG
jgi:hypothetical protein